jgi:hypothetical protein
MKGIAEPSDRGMHGVGCGTVTVYLEFLDRATLEKDRHYQ